MFFPTYIQLQYWYYPTGNTPAVNLIRDMQARDSTNKNLNILSLACGDPRNILFTLWNEGRHNTERNLTFTCCDIEPAVLARNVVLFTLVADRYVAEDATSKHQDPLKMIWNLFYHFFIPKSALLILREQSTRLLEVSKSLESWNSSPYGEFIGFIDKNTLIELRKYWVRYAQVQGFEELDVQARETIVKIRNKTGKTSTLHGLRAAGPVLAEAMEIMPYVFKRFWATGVVGGNPEDIAALGNGGKGLINPMFAVSSAATGAFAVHYGTDPLLGFHVAGAFADGNRSLNGNLQVKADKVAQVAKSEFYDWCATFKKSLERGRLTLKFFYGEALSLCHELQLQVASNTERGGVATAYIKPWSSSPLILNGSIEPTGGHKYELFDVIDTSNLGDHVGLLNLLSATAPLLRQQPSAVLYTESLLVLSEKTEEFLPTLLGSEVGTFSLMLGLAPMGYLTGVTCEAIGHEALLFNVSQQEKSMRQYHMRVPWKSPELLDSPGPSVSLTQNQKMLQITLEPAHLAQYLFGIYKKMFAHEDVTDLMSRMIGEQQPMDLQRYTRAGFVALLRIVIRRVKVDREKLIDLLLTHIQSDRSLLIGSNSLQDLYLHLHLFDVWTSNALEYSPRHIQNLGLVAREISQDKGLLAQKSIPSIVHVILVVPRQNLAIFTDKRPETIGTPAMHVSIRQVKGAAQYDNHFYSFHCSFGKVLNDVHGFDTVEVSEDQHGWIGKSDLIVSCPVPTFGMLTGPRDGIRVSLRLNNTPQNLMIFSLGPLLSVYEAGLEDVGRLFICHNAPGLNNLHGVSRQRQWMQFIESRKSSIPATIVKMGSAHQAGRLQGRIDFNIESVEGKALLAGAEVKLTQPTPCTALVHVGKSYSRRLVFPFCIKHTQSKIRVARKSSWVEVEVSISSAREIEGDFWTLITVADDHPPLPWSIPSVNLEVQPKFRIPDCKNQGSQSWLSTFLGTSLSDAERAMQNEGGMTTPRFDFKQSLHVLFASFAGQNKNYGNVRTFQLCVDHNCHTLLFANSVRHDLDLGSIVMDAYVIPLTDARVQELAPALGSLTAKAVGVNLSPGESTLWKCMLPALAERCRTWSHVATCQYRKKGVPLSTAINQTPLCSCGEGKVDADFRKSKIWAPFSKYATRVAIMPIFPVPYVESSMLDVGKKRMASGSAVNAQAAINNVTPTRENRCDACGRMDAPLKACAACGKARYCGQFCQKAAWKEHKKECMKK